LKLFSTKNSITSLSGSGYTGGNVGYLGSTQTIQIEQLSSCGNYLNGNEALNTGGKKKKYFVIKF
jgi:excinuclease UvrABC ATPase subunit